MLKFRRSDKICLTVLFSLNFLWLVACGSGTNATQLAPTARPLPPGTVSATGNALVAQYTISAPATATAVVQFGTDVNYGYETAPVRVSANGQALNILVAGMKQNTLYHMRAVVTYEDGSWQFDTDHSFQTGAILPERLPRMKVTAPSGTTPSPGVELISLIAGDANQLRALAIDPVGNVIWYYDFDPSLGFPQPIKLLPNGDMLMVLYPSNGAPGGTVREVDLAGNIVRQFDLNDLSQKLRNAGYNLQVFSLDHDIVWLPDGHLLLLVTDSRVFEDLFGYPGTTRVTGNAVVDVDSNNDPVWVWDCFDHLDVNRHPLYFPDWTHANALVYLPDDGNLLLSLRHQSWVVKIDYRNGSGHGDILWKLGYEGDFTIASGSPADWFFAQHDANIVSSNSNGYFQLALYDNGNSRVLNGDGTTCAGVVPPYCYSAAAIYEVDETAKTTNRRWSYVTPYSYWGGISRVLPNSNVFLDESAPVDLNWTSSRVMEVTQDPNPTVVWQLEIDNQNSYRTIHLPSLYPGVQW